ncbi:hypothetical protein UT300003_24700 [Clostridium sardiniense]
MMISEITVNKLKEIDSIKINLDNNLISYLSNAEGVSLRGDAFFFYAKKCWYKYIKFRYYNIKGKIYNNILKC